MQADHQPPPKWLERACLAGLFVCFWSVATFEWWHWPARFGAAGLLAGAVLSACLAAVLAGGASFIARKAHGFWWILLALAIALACHAWALAGFAERTAPDGAGPDRFHALVLAADGVLSGGRSLYTERTHTGTPITPMLGYAILLAPLRIMGALPVLPAVSALAMSLALRRAGSGWGAAVCVPALLFLNPIFVRHAMPIADDLMANSALVAAGAVWMLSASSHAERLAASLFGALAGVSRLVYIPIAAGASVSSQSRSGAISAAGLGAMAVLACATAALSGSNGPLHAFRFVGVNGLWEQAALLALSLVVPALAAARLLTGKGLPEQLFWLGGGVVALHLPLLAHLAWNLSSGQRSLTAIQLGVEWSGRLRWLGWAGLPFFAAALCLLHAGQTTAGTEPNAAPSPGPGETPRTQPRSETTPAGQTGRRAKTLSLKNRAAGQAEPENIRAPAQKCGYANRETKQGKICISRLSRFKNRGGKAAGTLLLENILCILLEQALPWWCSSCFAGARMPYSTGR